MTIHRSRPVLTRVQFRICNLFLCKQTLVMALCTWHTIYESTVAPHITYITHIRTPLTPPSHPHHLHTYVTYTCTSPTSPRTSHPPTHPLHTFHHSHHPLVTHHTSHTTRHTSHITLSPVPTLPYPGARQPPRRAHPAPPPAR